MEEKIEDKFAKIESHLDKQNTDMNYIKDDIKDMKYQNEIIKDNIKDINNDL